MKLNIKSFLVICSLMVYLVSCDFQSEENKFKQKKQWVYIELVTESKTDTSEYFYYGQINKSLIDDIESDKDKKGLFNLSNIRFWNNDLLELYEDDNLVGDLVFRVQDIEEVILYKDDPINLFDKTELHESAKMLKENRK